MPKLPELQVVIPYKTLTELLSAVQAVPELKKQLDIRDKQIDALRSQLVEVCDLIGVLRDEIRRIE